MTNESRIALIIAVISLIGLLSQVVLTWWFKRDESQAGIKKTEAEAIKTRIESMTALTKLVGDQTKQIAENKAEIKRLSDKVEGLENQLHERDETIRLQLLKIKSVEELIQYWKGLVMKAKAIIYNQYFEIKGLGGDPSLPGLPTELMSDELKKELIQ